MRTKGVRFVALETRALRGVNRLPLSANWIRDVRDPVRDDMLATLRDHLAHYAKHA
jgi:hypothetical protein